METDRVEPDSVPANVPFLTLWHEPQVPSAGSTALSSAVPETVVPDCESTHLISSALNESDPVPVHVPLTSTGVGVGVVGAEDGDLHAESDAAANRPTTAAAIALTWREYR